MLRVLLFALLACFATQAVASLPNISVKGAKFFAGGQQFFLKGVAYQGTPSDPLVDTNQCQLDAQSMQTIGTNSIRVYHVDPYADHDGCMSAFSDADIYVWLDLDTFNTTVVQTAPQWTEEQFAAFALVMDVFQGYDNLAGFWIGNEVINTAAGSPAAPYVKAATADMKSYMAAKKYRTIPIGYSAADIAELRPMLQNYLVCGDSQAQAIDFFGLNSYEWCGEATYENSGYSNLQAMAEGYSIPIFFSETGCNVGGARTFQDQNAIFGPEMSGTWSGSIIYEWVQETNDYGLVSYPDGQIYNGAPTAIQPDFDNLSNVWKTLTAPNIQEAAYTPSLFAPACPSASAGWGVNGNVPLPTLDSGSFNNVLTSSVVMPASTVSSPTSSLTQTPVTSGPSSSNSERASSQAKSSSSASLSATADSESATITGAPPPKATTSHSGASPMFLTITPKMSSKYPNNFVEWLLTQKKESAQYHDDHSDSIVLLIVLILAAVIALMFIATLVTGTVLLYYKSPGDHGTFGDEAVSGWGYRPDLCESGIEYKGPMDEVDITLQRVKERRLRKLNGLPPGTSLSGEGLQLYTLQRANYTVMEVGSDDEGEFPLLD